MKLLLTVSAIIELGAGLALMLTPSSVLNLLLGPSLDSPLAWTIAHLAALALLALGLACWLARCDSGSHAARALISGMLLYNLGVAALLAYAILALDLTAIYLWPAVLLHSGLTIWCIKCIWSHSLQK